MLSSIFKRPKILKSVIASIAQILLIVILLPFLAQIIKIVMPEKIVTFITSVLDEIPIISILSNYFMSFSTAEFLNSFSLFAYTIETITSSMLSMYIVGLFVYIFKKLGELIGIRGIPVLQTVVGIFLSCFCFEYIGDSLEKSIVFVVILMIISFVLAVIVQKGNVLKFFMDTGLGIGMATITAGTVCAYCTVLVLIIKGWFDSLLSAVNVLIWALIPALICLLIDYLLFGRKD